MTDNVMPSGMMHEIGRLFLCRACARRRSCSGADMLPAQKVARIKELEPEVPPVSNATIHDMNEELLCTIMLCLSGAEAAFVSTAGRLLKDLLATTSVWALFVKQEFPAAFKIEKTCDARLYHTLYVREGCKELRWRQVPCRHRLGEREGSPGVFYCNGYVFVFGGWGHGPEGDLHAGPIAVPLELTEINISGTLSGPPRTYEAKITLLEDDEPSEPSYPRVVRVAVTGGFLMGGYHGESCFFSILELTFSEATQFPFAAWVHTGEMTPRSNHSATFVPARIAGDRYPQGYLLLFGGVQRGRTTDLISVLDVASLELSSSVTVDVSGPAHPRNSHSATLLTRVLSNGVTEDAILLVGGGCGDGTNGGPPRGGVDYDDTCWLTGLNNAPNFSLVCADLEEEVPEILPDDGTGRELARRREGRGILGRGHVSFSLPGTAAAIISGGGYPPTNNCACLRNGKAQTVQSVSDIPHRMDCLPQPRSFGGGCALPDGTLLIYGGWHPRIGTFGDIWAAQVGNIETQFMKSLRENPVVPFFAAHPADAAFFTGNYAETETDPFHRLRLRGLPLSDSETESYEESDSEEESGERQPFTAQEVEASDSPSADSP